MPAAFFFFPDGGSQVSEAAPPVVHGQQARVQVVGVNDAERFKVLSGEQDAGKKQRSQESQGHTSILMERRGVLLRAPAHAWSK